MTLIWQTLHQRLNRSVTGLLTCIALGLPLSAHAQTEGAPYLGGDAPPILNTLATIPLSLELGNENLLARRLGMRVGASVYPLPLLLDRDLNIEGFADLTYTFRGGVGSALASADVAVYAAAGPRYRLLNSALFLDERAPGTYWGAGASAGAEFRLGFLGLSLVSAFAEAGGDYLWFSGDAPSDGALSTRVRVGLSLPLGGLSTTL